MVATKGPARCLCTTAVFVASAACLIHTCRAAPGEGASSDAALRQRPCSTPQFMPDGERLLVGRQSGVIEVRRLPQRSQSHYAARTAGYGLCVRVRSRRTCHSGVKRVWPAGNPPVGWCDVGRMSPAHVAGRRLFGAAFSRTGDLIAIGTDDDTIVLWDVKLAAVRRLLRGGTTRTTLMCFSPNPDSPQMACAGVVAHTGRPVAPGTAGGWTCGARTIWSREWFHGNSRGVLAIAFMPDGNRLVTGGLDRAGIRVFEDRFRVRAGSGAMGTGRGCRLIPLPGDRLVAPSTVRGGPGPARSGDIRGFGGGQPAGIYSCDTLLEVGTGRESALWPQ